MHKLLIGAALFFSMSAGAQELDPKVVLVPEIIVREDAQGNREVFKVSEKVDVKDATDAVNAINSFVKPKNKIAKVILASELDQTSSTEAWYFWGWNYGYHWYGTNFWYQPYFNYNFGFYNYYYYRWW
jgi:hypothetical protein